MAYLHCHACGWEQDDFWEWKWWDGWQRPFGYNPLSLMIEDVMNYGKPRIVNMDLWWAKENGFKSDRIYSWRMLLRGWRRHFFRLFTQRWWTSKSWYRSRLTARCPSCGSSGGFDID
ncbi:hypothetical protein KAR91_22905 [Candidatus Pacearchaeota archaeon]|nr:hypothetical protein [Candidatus Pacearchaeota archaeon]